MFLNNTRHKVIYSTVKPVRYQISLVRERKKSTLIKNNGSILKDYWMWAGLFYSMNISAFSTIYSYYVTGKQ